MNKNKTFIVLISLLILVGFASVIIYMMKMLWAGEKTVCPKCQKAELNLLHKKAKKSNDDWKCPECGEIYRTINMMYDLPNA